MLSKAKAQELAKTMKGYSSKDNDGHKMCDYCQYCYVWEGDTEHRCYFSQNQNHPIKVKKPCYIDKLCKEYIKIEGGYSNE